MPIYPDPADASSADTQAKVKTLQETEENIRATLMAAHGMTLEANQSDEGHDEGHDEGWSKRVLLERLIKDFSSDLFPKKYSYLKNSLDSGSLLMHVKDAQSWIDGKSHQERLDPTDGQNSQIESEKKQWGVTASQDFASAAGLALRNALLSNPAYKQKAEKHRFAWRVEFVKRTPDELAGYLESIVQYHKPVEIDDQHLSNFEEAMAALKKEIAIVVPSYRQ
ncbi:hypothetical protein CAUPRSCDRAFT_12916, partial [Caulochytrium protostelioides]